MQPARALALACLVLGAQAVPAQAYTLSLRQIGGTAVAGVGYVGDTVVIGIDFALEAGDNVAVVAPTLQWDREGGNVLDLVRATEVSSVAEGALTSINGAYRHGTLGTGGDFFENGSSFPGLAGPTFTAGWEQAALTAASLEGLNGPASFRMGTARFVFQEVGTTTLGFLVDPTDPWRSLVMRRGRIDETGDTTLRELDLSAVEFAPFSLTVLVPEPGTALLGGAGLLGLGLASRARAARRRDSSTPL